MFIHRQKVSMPLHVVVSGLSERGRACRYMPPHQHLSHATCPAKLAAQQLECTTELAIHEAQCLSNKTEPNVFTSLALASRMVRPSSFTSFAFFRLACTGAGRVPQQGRALSTGTGSMAQRAPNCDVAAVAPSPGYLARHVAAHAPDSRVPGCRSNICAQQAYQACRLQTSQQGLPGNLTPSRAETAFLQKHSPTAPGPHSPAPDCPAPSTLSGSWCHSCAAHSPRGCME